MHVEKCGICGKLSAVLHVCRVCERRVCEEHYKPQEGMCSLCYSRLSVPSHDAGEAMMSSAPIKLFLLGFVLTLVGVVVLIVSSLLGGSGEVSGGVILIVGFVPVIFGAGPYASLAVLIGAVLTIIAFVVFVWVRKQGAKG